MQPAVRCCRGRASTRRNVATAHDGDAHPLAALRLPGAPAAPDPATPEPTVRRDPGAAARGQAANANSTNPTTEARHGPLAVVARPTKGRDGSGGLAPVSDECRFRRCSRMIPASRGAAAPLRHRRASSPGENVVGGLFSDFEAVRTESRDRDAPRRSSVSSGGSSRCCCPTSNRRSS